jgi:hypothetical protein
LRWRGLAERAPAWIITRASSWEGLARNDRFASGLGRALTTPPILPLQNLARPDVESLPRQVAARSVLNCAWPRPDRRIGGPAGPRESYNRLDLSRRYWR